MTQQGISHVTTLIEHLWKSTVTGHLLKSSLEQLRIELGTNIPILSSDYKIYENRLLTTSWIRHTWDFMSNSGIKLKDQTTTIPTRRRYDSILMDEITNTASYTAAEINKINTVRIYLQAYTLSDICTGDGRQITLNAWEGRFEATDCRANNCRWPEWKSIHKSAILLWQQALSRSFCPTRPRLLQRPLAQWTTHPPTSWQWYLSRDRQTLYRLYHQQWTCFDTTQLYK